MGNAALLYDACEKGKVALARVLLDNGAEVDRACEDGRTPLYIACQQGHVDVARLLLERGAVVDSSALCEGDTVEAKYRGRRYYPGKISRDCGEGKYDIAYDDGDRERGVEARLIRKLLLSPLYIACKNGHVDAARLLLDIGAEVNWANKNGHTPLFVACEHGHIDAARLLLEKGAEKKRASKNGETPLWIACQKGHFAVATLLLDNGAAVDRANKNGTTPLSIAKQNCHSYIVGLLEEHLYPLLAAAKTGDVDAMARLLDGGAEINQATENGTTPLWIACENGHVDAARMLLDKGAEIDRANDEGSTPLDIAKRRQYHALVALLENHLARARPRLQRQQSDVQCSICLEPYSDRAWTKCNHSFCRECITRVCRTNRPANQAPCPFCRQPVLLREIKRRPYEHY